MEGQVGREHGVEGQLRSLALSRLRSVRGALPPLMVGLEVFGVEGQVVSQHGGGTHEQMWSIFLPPCY